MAGAQIGTGGNQPRRRLKLQTKLKIREAFNWTCQYCGYQCPESARVPHLSEQTCELHDFARHQTLHIDRIIPRARGGDYRFSNITLSCKRCNVTKGTGEPVCQVRSYADILGADG